MQHKSDAFWYMTFPLFSFFFGGECLVDAISPSPGLPAHLLRSLWPRKWQGGGGPGQKRWISSRWGDSIHHMEIHHGCFDRWLFFFFGGIESSKHRKWSILLNGNANLNIKILKNHPKTAVLTLSDNISFFFPHPSGKYIVYYWLQSLATLTLPPIITDYLHIHESQYLLTD